jgi:hypothetical protein
MSDEDLARALRTTVDKVSGEGREAAEEYYMDKAREYEMDMAGEYDYEEEEFKVNHGALQQIAGQIFDYAEGQVADVAADEGGYGFSGDAVQRKCDEIIKTLKDMVDARVASENT